MKKQLLKLSIACGLAIAATASFAQKRYVDDIFTSVLKTSNIEYDTNRSINILYGAVPGQLPVITASLKCDVYTPPANDTVNKRPVVIVMSTGSYLPSIVNRQATGNKDDSAIVELCTRFAMKGYVAVAMDYRIGWNAASNVTQDATEQLLKATYRAIQDARNCIRYIRSNATMYGVDTSKIVVGGQGTGGYVALAFGSVDKKAEIESNLKFLRSDATPMVSVDTLGDWHGSAGVTFPAYPYTLNYGGDPAVSGNAHMTFNYGGAMGDLAWLEASTLPVVGLHVTTDIFAPYKTGNVVVPTTGITVIPNASGAGDVIPKANLVGANAKINGVLYPDALSARAMSLSGNVGGLYPLYTQVSVDGAPWEWWDRPTIQAKTVGMFYNMPVPANGRAADSLSFLTNPLMSAAKGRAYIDTVVNFVAPRIAVQFDLVAYTPVGVKEEVSLTSQLSVYPNPAKTELNISLPVAISNVTIVDMTGREIMKSTSTKLDVSTLKQGLYFVNVKAVDGRSAVKRIVIE
ncbi:MAG: T9SS type A sorting domain-containing protein [Bacteroidota bacterium]